jgi:DNA repair protein RadA/Sms
LESAPGSVSQVRECTACLLRLAKGSGIPVFIIGHVTKDGSIAGPRVLEHMVDCVLYFEGERHYIYRILRAVKNRFGSTNEIGIFEMGDSGLKEVKNPSEMLLSGRPVGVSGSVVVSSIEGTRPILIEIQALLSPTTFGMPRRMTTGLDYNRVILLMAVLEKRIGLNLANQDAYLNVAGGIRIDEPAVDLGIAAAIASSFKEIRINPLTVAIGEIGLAGEIRGVSYIESRVKEASKLGFNTCVIPEDNLKGLKNVEGINIVGVKTLRQGLEIILGG